MVAIGLVRVIMPACSVVSVAPWPVAHRSLCPWGFSARILEWAAVPSSRRSSWRRDGACASCIGRWALRHLNHLINSSSSYLLSGNHVSGILWKSLTFVAEELVTTQHLIWSTFSSFLITRQTQNSLVVQWLKTHLPVQETCVQPLVHGDPTSRGATKTVLHNYRSPCTPKSRLLN